MSKPTSNFTQAIFFGTRKEDKRLIYLSAPSWDCDWYWGWGYLGNDDEHYHLSSYQRDPATQIVRNINMYDALLTDYELNPTIKENIWAFCELSLTAYELKKAAELFHRGGVNYTKNPCQNIIRNTEVEHNINHIMLPNVFNELWKLLESDT